MRPILLIACLLPFMTQAEEPKRLPAHGLGVDFIFTGLAEIPFGQFFEVEASAVPDPERDAPKWSRSGHLKVTAVNGKKLERPEEIPLIGDYKVPQGVVFRLTVVEEAEYGLFTTPNLSSEDNPDLHTRQRMFTRLRIIRQLAPEKPELTPQAEPARPDSPKPLPAKQTLDAIAGLPRTAKLGDVLKVTGKPGMDTGSGIHDCVFLLDDSSVIQVRARLDGTLISIGHQKTTVTELFHKP